MLNDLQQASLEATLYFYLAALLNKPEQVDHFLKAAIEADFYIAIEKTLSSPEKAALIYLRGLFGFTCPQNRAIGFAHDHNPDLIGWRPSLSSQEKIYEIKGLLGLTALCSPEDAVMLTRSETLQQVEVFLRREHQILKAIKIALPIEREKTLMATAAASQSKVFFSVQPSLKERIKSLLAADQYLTAIDFITEHGIEAYPTDVTCYLQRAKLYKHENLLNLAIQDYTLAILIDPQNTHHWVLRANLLEKIGDYAGAYRDYSQAIKLKPQNLEFLIFAANFLFKVGFTLDAIKEYSHILKIDPNNISVLKNRAWAYIQLEDFDSALQDYVNLLQFPLNPKEMLSIQAKMFFYIKRDYQTAANTCKKLLQQLPPEEKREISHAQKLLALAQQKSQSSLNQRQERCCVLS
ncbi:MAG: uncharacterized protein K0S08_2056 [Gammaproteobacteria bacterium]|nr:uncharacterized protein [Gammaproteobacteria bacterium]